MSAQQKNSLKDFMAFDVDFRSWKQRRGFRVTRTTLEDFDLAPVRALLQYHHLANIKTYDNRPVLPILDKKIRRQMAERWKEMTEEEQRGMASRYVPNP
jgi:hypothetical protein